MLLETIKLDFEKIEQLKHSLSDAYYAEYVFHKLFDNPSYTWEQSLKDPKVWNYPECWLARYYLYYVLHPHCFTDCSVLDLGSNLNFYSIWAATNGARCVESFEPDDTRFTLGKELVKIRNLEHKINCKNMSLNEFCKSYNGEKYDTVLLLDVFYYLTNGIDILNFIKNTVKPKYLIFESTVVDDFTEQGHFNLWQPSTTSTNLQLYTNSKKPLNHNLSLQPSKNALNNIVLQLGWKVVSYYTYSDFIGRGESPPRKDGHKNFYVLTTE